MVSNRNFVNSADPTPKPSTGRGELVFESIHRRMSVMSGMSRSRAFRFAALSGGVVVFFIIVPVVLGAIACWATRRVPAVLPRAADSAIGMVCAVLGLAWLVWAVVTFWRIGQGTPVPFAAPQRLVVSGPFRYSRNPIQFGAICFYLGIGSIVMSFAAGVLMFLIGLCLGSAYHKCFEEGELRLRFGSEYEEYRRRTPFIIPKPPRKTGLA